MRLPLFAVATTTLILLTAGPAGGQEPEYSREGADTCLSCHEGEAPILALFKGPHAVPTNPDTPFGHGQLQCEACHGPSGNHAGHVRRGQERPEPATVYGPESPTPVEEQNARCLACHKSDTGFGWHGNAHDDNGVACADCHTSHAAKDPVLMTSTQPEVCFTCHQDKRTETMKPYAHPIRQGKMACSGCHDNHGPTTEWQLVRQTLNDTCYGCHAEKRGPYLWEHAPVSEDCSLCHEPHGSNHPGMLTMRGPLLCQGCHSQAGHPSIARDASGLPDGVPSKYLLGENCLNCHTQVHGSNHPSGSRLMR
jgi:DmsE family decaheme c-type cytochrome